MQHEILDSLNLILTDIDKKDIRRTRRRIGVHPVDDRMLH